jgi:16S rRNA (guanine966-N2)-methyltransferase
MRIIAGKFKRKQLVTLAGNDITRPTSDRVKESIFNILQNEIADKVVLDLFSGSGALGLESLSRGAKKVIFVEENKGAIDCIRKNISNLNVANDCYSIQNIKVTNFLLNQSKHIEKIDIIFADPPYQTDWYQTALKEIQSSGLCNNDCLVILEMPIEVIILKQNNWSQVDIRKYGKTKIEIWKFEYN